MIQTEAVVDVSRGSGGGGVGVGGTGGRRKPKLMLVYVLKRYESEPSSALKSLFPNLVSMAETMKNYYTMSSLIAACNQK